MMHKEFLMGNEAIALGAMAAGVNLVSGYPGTPSTEVLETVAKNNDGSIYVEWSVNEKAGLEVAAGASYAGARSMVTMKQVGMNVASDPLMSLEYVGIKGGMVVVVADDPGPISSQTEQDTRRFASYSKIPCFDPSSAQEAYFMIQEAFELSESLGTPVIFRPTTRVCHGYASIEVKDKDEYTKVAPKGFIRDPSKFVIFPRLSYNNHITIEARNEKLSETFSEYAGNSVSPSDSDRGIVSQGISYTYVLEAVKGHNSPKIMKVSTPFPFPEKKAVKFLDGLKEVLVIEELDPVIERELVYTCGKYHLGVKIKGKLTHDVRNAGENTVDSVKHNISEFMGWPEEEQTELPTPPALPVRPPVLCAGCPHRASFYAVKRAMKGRKCIFCGDIGCYTLGNAMPLDMCDTCLCMGAGIDIAQGVGHVEPDTSCFAFVGDSTFFASAMTGIVNAVYNQSKMTVIILDNSTTAMTGHQPHPGTGRTMMGDIVQKISIQSVLAGIGVTEIATVDPLDLPEAVETVRRIVDLDGVKAIVFKSPCVVLSKSETPSRIDKSKCTDCRVCVKQIGCPAIVNNDGKVDIDRTLCTGCGLCKHTCPNDAIVGGWKK